MKILTDMHTHTAPASFDAKNTLREMLAEAVRKGMTFFGISNHFDYDYDLEKRDESERKRHVNGDTGEYFHEARHLQEDYAGVLNVVVGAEFGYADDPKIWGRYAATYEKYRPDYVINSLHGTGGKDYAFCTCDRDEANVYTEYLKLVRRSLDAPYPYDIVGHIEYIVRYVPFANREIDVEKFGGLIDDILLTIIRKDKILEVNSSTKQLPRVSLPSERILRRYYALGGRNISYGSDAHDISRIGDKRETLCKMVKEIGFTHWCVPCRGEYIKVEV